MLDAACATQTSGRQEGQLCSNVSSKNPVKLALRHIKAWQVLFSNEQNANSTQAELAAQLGKVIGVFSEKLSALEGRTTLQPLPVRSNDGSLDRQGYVQVLEGTMLHWTRQIQEALAQETSQGSQSSSPLAELGNQQQHRKNLAGIIRQLDSNSTVAALDLVQNSGSVYSPPFQILLKSLRAQLQASEEKLIALKLCEAPCRQISNAALSELHGPYKALLLAIKQVWAEVSLFRNKTEMIGLLSQIANEILNRCCAAVTFQDIFSSKRQDVEAALHMGVAAIETWLGLYQEFQSSEEAATLGWDIPLTAFSGRAEALLQRFREVTEICEAQEQFTALASSYSLLGASQAELLTVLDSVEGQFNMLARKLQQLGYDTLDVTSRSWFSDLLAFLTGTEGLEKQLVFALQQAYSTAGHLSARLKLLPMLQAKAVRPRVRRAVTNITHGFYEDWLAELAAVKKAFEGARLSKPNSFYFPSTVASAHQILSFHRRLTSLLEEHAEVAKKLEANKEAADVAATVAATINSLSQYLSNMHQEWSRTIDAVLASQLDQPVISQDAHSHLLSVNFGKQLAEAFEEGRLWSSLGYSVSKTIAQLQADAERLRLLRWSVEGLINQHNQVKAVTVAVKIAHKGLFNDRMRYLSKRMAPGIHKLTWTAPKPALDFFFREAHKTCKETANAAAAFAKSKQDLEGVCQAFGRLEMLSVEPKHVYHLAQFEALQDSHQAELREGLASQSSSMVESVRGLYVNFADHGPVAQKGWQHFIDHIEQKMEDGLTTAVKQGVAQVGRSLVGDKKTEVPALFHVTLMLEKNNRLELKPTVQELFNVLHSVSKKFQTVLQSVTRLPRLANSGGPTHSDEQQGEGWQESPKEEILPSFYEAVCAKQQHTQKAAKFITDGVTGIVDKVQTLLVYWEKKFKPLWETDKDAFIRRYERANRPLQSYEADIANYKNMAEEILLENSSETVKFLFLDCNPLKEVLVHHCQLWTSRLTASLSAVTSREIASLSEELHTKEQDILQARQALGSQEPTGLSGEEVWLEDIKARTEAVASHIEALASYKISVSPADSRMAAELPHLVAVVEAAFSNDKKNRGGKANRHRTLQDS